MVKWGGHFACLVCSWPESDLQHPISSLETAISDSWMQSQWGLSPEYSWSPNQNQNQNQSEVSREDHMEKGNYLKCLWVTSANPDHDFWPWNDLIENVNTDVAPSWRCWLASCQGRSMSTYLKAKTIFVPQENADINKEERSFMERAYTESRSSVDWCQGVGCRWLSPRNKHWQTTAPNKYTSEGK